MKLYLLIRSNKRERVPLSLSLLLLRRKGKKEEERESDKGKDRQTDKETQKSVREREGGDRLKEIDIRESGVMERVIDRERHRRKSYIFI